MARRVERVAEHADELKDEPGKLYAFKCDMTVEEEIVSTFKEIINKIGDIHILINNAGLGLPTDLINGDTSMWKTVLGILYPSLFVRKFIHTHSRYKRIGFVHRNQTGNPKHERERH